MSSEWLEEQKGLLKADDSLKPLAVAEKSLLEKAKVVNVWDEDPYPPSEEESTQECDACGMDMEGEDAAHKQMGTCMWCCGCDDEDFMCSDCGDKDVEPCCGNLCVHCCAGEPRSPKKPPMPGGEMIARTQKAKGIKAMNGMYEPLNRGCELWGGAIIRDVESAQKFFPRAGSLFARPCPSRPRHGFVDSRVVKSANELAKVVAETLEADPEGEVIVGRHIDAPMSAILAGDRLAIGPGNDGATSGKDVVELGVRPFPLDPITVKKADIKGTAYIEVVYDLLSPMANYATPTLVQLRDGPNLPPAASDYVPHEVEVKRVVHPCEDMLEWEKKVAELEEGDVVWAPDASLASHAAIHCVANTIPFLTRAQPPKVGEKIEPTDLAASVSLDPQEMLAGMEWAADVDQLKNHTKGQLTCKALVASSVVHNWAYLRKWPIASRLMGAAVVGLAQVCASLCAGEARHYDLEKRKQKNPTIARTACWDKAMKSTEDLATYLADARLAFSLGGWSGGYGGKGWREAAQRTEYLWSLVKEVQDTGKVQEEKLIGALNACLNAVHNNGSLLDKLSITHILDGPPALTALHAAPTIQKIAQYVPKGELCWPDVPERDLPPAAKPKAVKHWAQARVGTNLQPDMIKIQVYRVDRPGEYQSHMVYHPAAAKLLQAMEHNKESCAGPDNAMYVQLRDLKQGEMPTDLLRDFVKKNGKISYE